MTDEVVIDGLTIFEHEEQDMSVSRYERGRNKRIGFLVHMERVEVLDLDVNEATALRDLLDAALDDGEDDPETETEEPEPDEPAAQVVEGRKRS